MPESQLRLAPRQFEQIIRRETPANLFLPKNMPILLCDMKMPSLTNIIFVVLVMLCYALTIDMVAASHSHGDGSVSLSVIASFISESQSPNRELTSRCDLCLSIIVLHVVCWC